MESRLVNFAGYAIEYLEQMFVYLLLWCWVRNACNGSVIIENINIVQVQGRGNMHILLAWFNFRSKQLHAYMAFQFTLSWLQIENNTGLNSHSCAYHAQGRAAL